MNDFLTTDAVRATLGDSCAPKHLEKLVTDMVEMSQMYMLQELSLTVSSSKDYFRRSNLTQRLYNPSSACSF